MDGTIMPTQFEWAWQHPERSLQFKHAATSTQQLQKVAKAKQKRTPYKLSILWHMFQLPRWSRMPLRLHIVNSELLSTIMNAHSKTPFSPLPKHVLCTFGAMDQLPFAFDNGKHDEGTA